MESEKTLERKLVEGVKARGGMCVKLTSQYHRGLPDRMCVMPCGMVYFAELKSTGKRPTALQEKTLGWLRANGHVANVIDSSEGVADLLELIDAEQKLLKKA